MKADEVRLYALRGGFLKQAVEVIKQCIKNYNDIYGAQHPYNAEHKAKGKK